MLKRDYWVCGNEILKRNKEFEKVINIAFNKSAGYQELTEVNLFSKLFTFDT
jgi:hypothetical protein